MVALQHDEAVLRRATASTISLQFGAEITQVDALGINTFNYCGGLAPFSSLKADLNKLLFHADGSADAEIFWKPTSGAYFRHNFVQLLLFSIRAYRPGHYLSLYVNTNVFDTKDGHQTQLGEQVDGNLNGKPEDSGRREHKDITVETLSTPPVQTKPAPLTRRLAANIVDSVVIALAWISLTITTGGKLISNLESLTKSSSDIYVALLAFAYYFVCEGLFAATIGKAALKLRVFTKDGELCSFSSSFKRNILRFVDWLPIFYVVGAIFVLTSSKRQRIGDMLARTIVSRAPEKDINPPPAPFLFH